ncbi:MAG: hypothetical protein ACM35H_14195 [Bacteroidota bacterium]
MANDITRPGVIFLDTAADNILAAGVPVTVHKVRFVRPTAAGVATLTDAGGSAAKIELAAVAAGSDTVDFYGKPLVLNGLRALAIAAGGGVYIYTANH